MSDGTTYWSQGRVIEELRATILKRDDPIPLLSLIDLLPSSPDTVPDRGEGPRTMTGRVLVLGDYRTPDGFRIDLTETVRRIEEEAAHPSPALDVERLAGMAVMSLGEFTTMPEFGRIHEKFRASFVARLRRAKEYNRG